MNSEYFARTDELYSELKYSIMTIEKLQVIWFQSIHYVIFKY